MDTKIPVKHSTPRPLKHIPRSAYSSRTPSLKRAHKEANRRSFISLLRKGPDSDSSELHSLPSALRFNCAVWLLLDKKIHTNVSLVIHCQETREEYCLQIEETNPNGANALMLSGQAEISPDSDITSIHLALIGIPDACHIYVEGIHCDVSVGKPITQHRRAS